MQKLIALGAAVLAMHVTTAAAQTSGTGCKGSAGALGVSRVVEIDAAGGPKYGQLQYRDNDFLKPGEVVLTFDDGPLRRYTRRVLDALATHCTKGTFFLVGRMAVSDPGMVKEIAALGHTIGTHTWSHLNIRAQSAASAEREIELGMSAIRMAAGRPISPFFRFPYLADSERALAALKERNVATFSIDIDSRDFRTHSGDQMRRNIFRQLETQGKGILLFHDIQMSTANGILNVLDELKTKKYRVVHIVSKTPDTTIATYDAAAEKLLAGKPSALAGVDESKRRTGVIAPVKPVYTVAAPTAQPSATTVAAPRPVPRPKPDSDWRQSVFGFD